MSTGVPNPKNAYHLVLLKEICLNRGIDVKIVDDVILTLEQDDKKVDPETIVKFKDKDGENKEMEYQNAIRQPEDTPARDAAEKLKKSGGEDDKPSGSQLGPSDFDSTDYMKSEPDVEDVGKKDDGDDSDNENQSQQKERIINGKNKTLKKVNSSETETFTEDIEPNDDEFNNDLEIGEPPPKFEIPEELNKGKFPKNIQN